LNIPQNEGDQTEEKLSEERIAMLVNLVRGSDCELSFVILRGYLSNYISLFERRYRIPGCDADEIEQECLYALRYKAIEDFNPTRGKFRSFAILCMKRHLFSIIKGSNQQKRRVLNESLSLDEDRSDGDNLSLNSLVEKGDLSAEEKFEREELLEDTKNRLLSKLSRLEQEVFKLYIRQFPYDEIAEELGKIFPTKKFTKKSVDNALVRVRLKSRTINIINGFFEEK